MLKTLEKPLVYGRIALASGNSIASALDSAAARRPRPSSALRIESQIERRLIWAHAETCAAIKANVQSTFGTLLLTPTMINAPDIRTTISFSQQHILDILDHTSKFALTMPPKRLPFPAGCSIGDAKIVEPGPSVKQELRRLLDLEALRSPQPSRASLLSAWIRLPANGKPIEAAPSNEQPRPTSPAVKAAIRSGESSFTTTRENKLEALCQRHRRTFADAGFSAAKPSAKTAECIARLAIRAQLSDYTPQLATLLGDAPMVKATITPSGAISLTFNEQYKMMLVGAGTRRRLDKRVYARFQPSSTGHVTQLCVDHVLPSSSNELRPGGQAADGKNAAVDEIPSLAKRYAQMPQATRDAWRRDQQLRLLRVATQNYRRTARSSIEASRREIDALLRANSNIVLHSLSDAALKFIG